MGFASVFVLVSAILPHWTIWLAFPQMFIYKLLKDSVQFLEMASKSILAIFTEGQ